MMVRSMRLQAFDEIAGFEDVHAVVVNDACFGNLCDGGCR
jgi:hypothetical protein